MGAQPKRKRQLMNKVQFLESLLWELEEVDTLDEAVSLVREKLEDAEKEMEIGLMMSSDALFNDPSDEDIF